MSAGLSRNMTMVDALESVAARRGRRVALRTPEERLTYRDLQRRAATLATNLHHLGVREGGRIATLLWGEPEFVYLFFAAARLGAVVAPLPPRMRRPALENVLAELAPDMIVASSSLEVEGGLDVLRQSRPPRSAVAVVGEAAPGLMSLQDLLGEEAALAEPTAPVVPQDLLAVLYTSGTTGRPKGVMHSHRSLISPVVASIRLREIWSTPFPAPARLGRWARVLMRYGTRLLSAASRPQVMLSTMPLHTISGLEAMLQALLMGDTLVLLPRFHPVRVLEAIERERVTVLIGTPLMYQTLMAVRGFERYRLSSLLICAAGAAPCPPTLAREIQRRFRCAVHIGFGMTELGGGIAAPSLEDSPGHQAETVGRAMPGMEILVVDEARRPVPPGTVGELACRSDSVMLGYFGETTDTSAPVDEEGWLYTGDLAVMDEQGYLRIVGRKKDMIIRGGQNVYPVRLEQFLGAIPGVREAAVVGVPDPLLGESVWAFVVPSPESVMSEADLFERCRAGLEAHEVPQEIRLLPDFPRTSSGKPRKPELRELALREREIHEPVAETQTHL